jgi:hypothetical protein
LLDIFIPYHFHDTAIGQEVNRGVIFEEAFKFVGITAWTVFHLRAAWRSAALTLDRTRKP